jgi:hypothetical protein
MIDTSLANYIKDLLVHNASLVLIGRENFRTENTSEAYIIIDELISTPVASSYEFDETLETETFSTVISADYTIDFYGTNARTNASKFIALQKSQKAYELQRDLGIQVNHVTTLNNLKKIEGSKYSNRYQVSLSVVGNETQVIDTLRIDTAEVEIINNK